MIIVSHYKKEKGQKNFRKNGENSKYLGSIKDWQMINSIRKYKNNPNDYVCKTDYSNFGRTYTRTIKSKRTGITWKTIVKEK